jgi:hypothetical protein
MKKLISIIGFILVIVDLYLINVYNIHGGWNKLEQRIFAIALIPGLINLIIFIPHKKGLKKDELYYYGEQYF